jgi:hypothetical protein
MTDTLRGPYRLGQDSRWQLKEAYSVPLGQQSTKVYAPQTLLITFSTEREEGTDFYLHVEGQDSDGRFPVYDAQAWIFKDGHSGYGPYILVNEHIRKIFIQNGTHGVVEVAVYQPN